MPTISNEPLGLRAALALLLLGASGAALASGTIEIDPRIEAFASRAACEKALERRHKAALARVAALPAEERRTSRVDALKRDGDGLGYSEVLGLTGDASEIGLPGSQTESFICRGSTLEHRIDYKAGG
ncbi:MAG TPA: hypothetical protein VGB57_06050 [Allosphingosinicella sp.]|jgi:hypothetical protein